jgi:hypothetical protein
MNIDKINVFWVEVTAFFAGLGAFIRFVWPKIQEVLRVIRMNSRRSMEQATADIAKIIYHMRDILELTDAVQVVLLKAHNGGEPIKIGTWLYSSVIYEVRNPGEQEVKDRWVAQPLDELYLEMLARLQRDKKINLITKELKSGTLKDVYVSNNVAFTKVTELFSTKDMQKYFYLSCVFKKDFSELTAAERDQIRSSAQAITNIYIRNEYFV